MSCVRASLQGVGIVAFTLPGCPHIVGRYSHEGKPSNWYPGIGPAMCGPHTLLPFSCLRGPGLRLRRRCSGVLRLEWCFVPGVLHHPPFEAGRWRHTPQRQSGNPHNDPTVVAVDAATAVFLREEAYLNTHTHTRTHTHTHTHTHTFTHSHIHTFTHTHIYICIYTYIYIYTYKYICIYIYIYTYMYNIYIHIYIYICIYIHIHIYIYMHISLHLIVHIL